ncbi:MAG TPA: glycosyl transferase [Erysipelotrichaceae bacterium]|nr:glycosyl transferase [Erysipelotrichaceae bacterium]
MPLFSIIVPIYNVELYLKECLDSILSQTFNDFELILVNDGSTDKSGDIAKEYKNKYNNIKLIDKENGGLSSARNAGIKKAIGDYILFIDSDDMLVNKSALSNIVPYLKNNDVILLGFEKLYFDNTTTPVVNNANESLRNKSVDEKIVGLIKSNIFVTSACNKCINRKYFIDNNLFFEEGILSEDIEWSIRLLLTVNNIDFTNKPYYYYRQSREGSISTTVSQKHIFDMTNSINKCIDYINNSRISFEKKDALLNFLAYQYMVLMAYYIEADSKLLKTSIKKLNYLLNYDSSKKVRIINLLRKLVGYEITAILMNKFVRNRK